MAQKRTAEAMIEVIDRYFDAVDAGDVEATLAVLTPDCTLSVVTDNIAHKGRDSGIRRMFKRRAKNLDKAWHGNRRYVADPKTGTAATRFDVRSTFKDGGKRSMDNINFFEFKGLKLHRISIWMSGENTLR